MTQLVDLYGVEDEDGLPINFDLLEVLETPKDKRQAFLAEKLTGCPKGACVPACVHACVGWCRGPRATPRSLSRSSVMNPSQPPTTATAGAVEELLKKVDELNVEI